MKGSLIALDEINGHRVAAHMVDGRLEDLLIDPLGDVPAPGAILRATVDRQMKGQGGVFLSLPGRDKAFLRQGKGLAPGQPLLVQVTGMAEPGKAVPVTTKVLFKSRYAIVTPDAPGLNVSRAIRDEDERNRLLEIAHEEMDESAHGLILRSACEGISDDTVAEDVASMRALAEQVLDDAAGVPELLVEAPDAHLLAWRDWPQPDQLVDEKGSFDTHGVLDALDHLQSGAISGGLMFVEPTRALVAVDVNTGGDASPAAGLKANMAAARDLPRQLRLHGLGGQVVIDFAPMPKKDRRQLEQVLRSAFRADAVDTTLAGWTPLGNYELQRKRERTPTDWSLFA